MWAFNFDTNDRAYDIRNLPWLEPIWTETISRIRQRFDSPVVYIWWEE